MTDDEAARVDGGVEQVAERERRVEAGVEAQPRRGLGDDEVAGEEDVPGLPQARIVVADARVGAIAAPQERDERARVGVDDPQARSLGAP